MYLLVKPEGAREEREDARKLLADGIDPGDKRTQTKDIECAHEYWKDYQARRQRSVPCGGLPASRRSVGLLAEVMRDSDTRALPLALRTAADVLGMAELARRTGLNRKTLYRTLSETGNPRLDTLAAILDAFGLRLNVQPRKHAQRKATQGAPHRADT